MLAKLRKMSGTVAYVYPKRVLRLGEKYQSPILTIPPGITWVNVYADSSAWPYDSRVKLSMFVEINGEFSERGSVTASSEGSLSDVGSYVGPYYEHKTESELRVYSVVELLSGPKINLVSEVIYG